MSDNPMAIDDLIDDMTEDQVLRAGARALRRYGVEYEWRADGSGIDITDPDIVDLDKIMDSPDYLEYFEDELKKVAADNLLEGLVAKGVLVRDGVGENGEIDYVLAPGVKL